MCIGYSCQVKKFQTLDWNLTDKFSLKKKSRRRCLKCTDFFIENGMLT